MNGNFLTSMQASAIELNEFLLTCIEAGFTREEAFELVKVLVDNASKPS